MIKELAAAYHAECLTSCQELLELQKKWDEVSNKTNHLNEVLFCSNQLLGSYSFFSIPCQALAN